MAYQHLHCFSLYTYFYFNVLFLFLIRQPPAFPCRLQHSIIGLPGLNHRVRDGYGCVPWAHRHRNSSLVFSSFVQPLMATRSYQKLRFRCSCCHFGLPIHSPASSRSLELAPSTAPCSLLCTNSLTTGQQSNPYFVLRKEVIQPHLPIRLPCYDFTPVTRPAFGGSFLSVRSPTSGISDSHGVTGGVYKTRERIHRSILICDY